MEKYDIFISFSNKDREKVEKLVNIISSYNVSCWFQKTNSKGDYVREINSGINNSNAFVVFLSKSSVSSLMVRNEVSRAIKKYKEDASFKVLPIVIDDFDSDDEEEALLLLGVFNWIYEKEYEDLNCLVLAAFAQLRITFSDGNKQSIYTGNEEKEIERIKAQNDLLNMLSKPYLDEVFSSYKRPLVLDVGCSDGMNILRRLGGYDYGGLLGIDKNVAKIERAKLRLETKRNFFACCDIETDGWEEFIRNYLKSNNRIGFDIIHISSVLLHLKEPNVFLHKIQEFLTDEGTIFIQDEDDGFNLTYPYNKYLTDCFYIWDHSIEAGDRKMGRKIPYYLSKNNYSDIRIFRSTVSSLDLDGKMKQCLWDLYFNSDFWVVDNASYFDDLKAYELFLEYREKQKELKEEFLNDRYFIMLGVFFISAKRLS